MSKAKTTKKAAKAGRKVEKKAGLKISDAALARAKVKPRQEPVNVFGLAAHPAGVVPAGAPTMAQDDNLNASAAWANQAINGIFADGVTFLGYPYLSELAQRPEYRRISETLAMEMTRKWIKLQATGDEDKTEKLRKLEAAMKRLKVQSVFRKAAEQDGFFGRSHIYLDFGTTDDADELMTPIGDGSNDISKAKIKPGSLKRLKFVEAVWCYPTDYNSNDPLRPDWYKPSSWFVQGRQIHASRLLTFVGREVPDLLKPAYSFGGLSMSQMAKPYVDNWIRTRQSVADLLHSFSVNGINIDLAAALEVQGATGGDLFKRIDLFNTLRDNRGLMVLDKEEKFFNVSTPLGTLDVLQAQTQEHMAAVSGIPIVKLLGIQPAGLNASSEGEIRSFYDWIHAFQEHLFTDQLNRVIGFVQLSEFGEVDPDISFVYEPLWSLDEIQLAQARKTDAETGNILIANKTISPAEERKRIAADPEAPYASLDADIVPVEPLSEIDKATIAVNITNAVTTAESSNLISRAMALKALKKSSAQTDLFADISDQDIAEAEAEPPIPGETDLGEPPVPESRDAA